MPVVFWYFEAAQSVCRSGMKNVVTGRRSRDLPVVPGELCRLRAVSVSVVAEQLKPGLTVEVPL